MSGENMAVEMTKWQLLGSQSPKGEMGRMKSEGHSPSLPWLWLP